LVDLKRGFCHVALGIKLTHVSLCIKLPLVAEVVQLSWTGEADGEGRAWGQRLDRGTRGGAELGAEE